MSDFDDLRDDADAPAAHPGEADPAVSVGGDSTAAAPVNPRKRKKSSRALVLTVPCRLFIPITFPTPVLLCVRPRCCLASSWHRPTIPAPPASLSLNHSFSSCPLALDLGAGLTSVMF